MTTTLPIATPDKLTRRKDGRWCKWHQGKMYYLGTGTETDARREWERIKDEIQAGKKPAHAKTKDEVSDELTLRSDGRWCKSVGGRVHYFGRGTLSEARQEWHRVKDDLLAGRKPRPKPEESARLADVCNQFLDAKRQLWNNSEITGRTWLSLFNTCQRLTFEFGRERAVTDLTVDDWQTLRTDLAVTRGPVSLGNEIQRVRSVFKWAWEAGLIETPMRFGPDFKRPSKKVMRLAAAEKGPKLFEAVQCCKLSDAADVHLRAMIYLGLNCGYGNSDCGTLPIDRVDLKGGWINYHRPKTGIQRRCPLWPETVAALKASLAKRPEPKSEDHRPLFFVTKYGNTWAKQAEDNPVTKEFAKLLRNQGLHRPGLGFYALRHTFRTVADAAKDQPAANAIMGHADESMAAVYRQKIEDDRLRAVTDHVRAWLLAARKPAKRSKK